MPFVIDVLFIGFWLAFAYGIVTQIVFPVIRGTVLFPMFRPKIRQAQEELTTIHEEKYEREIIDLVERERQQAAEEEHLRAERKKAEEERVKNAAAASVIVDTQSFMKP